MSYHEVDQRKRFYCEVVGDGEPLRGTFCIDGGDIRLSLARFDRFVRVDADQPFRVRTEEGWFASLFETFDGGSSFPAGGTAAHRHDVVSNVALVGADAWSDADPVRRVSFRMPGADPLLTSSPAYSAALDSRMGTTDTELFKVTRSGEVIEGWLALTGGMSSSRPHTVEPWITMHFDEGRCLTGMRRAVTDVARFVSACAGVKLRAVKIVVSRYSQAELLDRASRREAAPDHSVYYYDGADDPNRNLIDRYRTLADLRAADGRPDFEASLSAWRDREEKWTGASAMMLDALGKAGEMSASRLLTAMRWLEETPDAKPRGKVDKAHTRALAKLVGKWSRQLGYADLGNRFRGAVALVALESSRERFARLVGDIRSVFGQEIVGDDMVGWLVEAARMRGPAAHGARTGLDDDQRVFTTAVHAAECAALLLMLKDLPLGARHVRDARRHLLVQAYRQSGMGKTPAQVRAGPHA